MRPVRPNPMRALLAWLAALLIPAGPALSQSPRPGTVQLRPPEPQPLRREFRGVWIATVGNIDWPSRPGLHPDRQKAELVQILDLAQRLRFNAVILQVRPAADAFYSSTLEPWSEYLTGRMGTAPNPEWDPLKFAVTEAHARALELHAWFNPFRAGAHKNARSYFSPLHIAQRQPHLTRQAGPNLWLDPGESDVREHSTRVILDVVRRYDIDGVHLDDYFYPYPENGVVTAFPDDRSWQRYRRTGGPLDRSEWRRSNVNTFVEGLSRAIHAEKPWVKFGISPFGIWRPGHPPSVRGLDAYEILSADALRWFQFGWVDYLAPQLYWPIHAPEQRFPVLLNWWAAQNTYGRELWPGLDLTKIGQDRNAAEIIRQIEIVRREPQSRGVILYSARSLLNNQGSIASTLPQRVFADLALTPPMPWLDTNAPPPPKLAFELSAAIARLKLTWTAATNPPPHCYVVHTRYVGRWFTELLPPTITEKRFDQKSRVPVPDEIRITPFSRTGAEGGTSIWRRPSPQPVATPPPRRATNTPPPRATNAPPARPTPSTPTPPSPGESSSNTPPASGSSPVPKP